MKLNHLNLTVTDPVAARDFLVKHFSLRAGGGNRGMQLVNDDNGLVLTLMKGKGLDVTYPPSFHIGFIQATEREVDAINRRLREDGFEVAPPARLHGAWTFYFTAPGGFVIEVLG